MWMLGPNIARLIQDVKRTTFETMHKPFEITKGKIVSYQHTSHRYQCYGLLILYFMLQSDGTANMSLVSDALSELRKGDIKSELIHIEAFGSIYNGTSMKWHLSKARHRTNAFPFF